MAAPTNIGFQSLSGAMERGHEWTYICYDNGAYMNNRHTAFVGYAVRGGYHHLSRRSKCPEASAEERLTKIIARTGYLYVAQDSPSHWRTNEKVVKAL